MSQNPGETYEILQELEEEENISKMLVEMDRSAEMFIGWQMSSKLEKRKKIGTVGGMVFLKRFN